MTNAVAVVGCGLLTPVGAGIDASFEGLMAAANTDVMEALDQQILVRRAPDVSTRLTAAECRRLDRVHQLAFVAVEDALANVSIALPSPDRCAVAVGTGFGAGGYLETQHQALAASSFRSLNPVTIPMVMPNSVAAQIAIRCGFHGPAMTYTSACAAGSVAIGEAMWLLRNKRADLVVAGGVDAMLVPTIALFFARLGAMSSHLEDPSRASRPFDVNRDGFVLAEGAVFLVLVRAEDCESNLGLLHGYGSTTDAVSLVAPDPTGAYVSLAMQAALVDARIGVEDLAFVNAHGTSTPANDRVEGDAILRLSKVALPVTAPKGATGHMIAASGAFEAIAAISALRHNRVPPIVGLVDLDPRLPDLDVVVGSSRDVFGRYALSNSFAFGGHNTSLVVGL